MNILINTFSFPSIKENVHDGRFVYSEAIGYAENGAVIKVLTPHYPGADKTEQVNENIEIIRFRYFFPSSLQALKKPGLPIYGQKSFLAIIQIPLLCLFFTLNILKHASWAHIIHAQWTVTALLCLPVKWIMGKKIVLTARGSDLRLLPRWLNRFIHHQVDAAVDCFGPQPRNASYLKTFSANFITLPLIVSNHGSQTMPEDMKEVVDSKPDTFIVLFVGRFDYLKIKEHKLPLLDLIRASEILKTKDINFHVFYIGEGDDCIKKEMSALIDKNSLHDCVTLLGAKINVLDYIRYCNLGVGGVAFNATSQEFTISGKAQILVEFKYNTGTPWRNGVNAILVKPDDPADLGEKLVWATKNREQVRKIGENARNEMSKYIVDSKVGGRLYLREFQNLLK